MIGKNGSGKSSLLKILANLDTDFQGDCVRKNNLVFSYLSQSVSFTPEQSVADFIFDSNNSRSNTIRNYLNALESPEKQDDLEELTKQMDSERLWDYELLVKNTLRELKILSISEKMNALSGGMQKKVAIAKLLFTPGDVYLLDEPTNHLDLESILFLQTKLMSTDKTFILITHDRYFLEEVCDRILEIDNGVLREYPGNYSVYLTKKAEESEQQKREEEKRENFLRREREWLQRQPKARGTKQKARSERIEEVLKFQTLEKNSDLEFSISGRRLGKKVLELHSVAFQYGEKQILSDVNYTFKKQERVGIVGPNGSGKTTLVNLIAERLKPSSGKIVKGLNTNIGYFDQNTVTLPKEKTILSYIKEECGNAIENGSGEKITAADLLKNFLFPSNSHSQKIGSLSGGELRRYYLVTILAKNPNFLILDEPTNDLDIATLSILEAFLEEFPGCVLSISHDRYFMDRVCDSLLLIRSDQRVEKFHGNYLDYTTFKEAKVQTKESSESRDSLETKKKIAKPSFQEKKEFEVLQKDIKLLESDLEKLKSLIHHEDYKIRIQASEDYKNKESILEQKLERWMELEERHQK